MKAALHAVRQLYGTMPAAQFGPPCLEAVQQRVVEEGKSRGYVNHLVRIIRQVFKRGVSKQIVPVPVTILAGFAEFENDIRRVRIPEQP